MSTTAPPHVDYYDYFRPPPLDPHDDEEDETHMLVDEDNDRGAGMTAEGACQWIALGALIVVPLVVGSIVFVAMGAIAGDETSETILVSSLAYLAAVVVTAACVGPRLACAPCRRCRGGEPSHESPDLAL
jgi:hypothetical protein